MKKTITTLLLIAASIFAQNQIGQAQNYQALPASSYLIEQPDLYYHQHRGFYFSNGLSIAYTYLRHHYGFTTSKNMEDSKINGYLLPYEEIRLGASIANLISIYGALGVGTGSGHYEYVSDYAQDTTLNEKIDCDERLLKFLFGGGAEFYPIRDKLNPVYGIFIGLTIGLSIDMALDHNDFVYYFARFEVGKDWWFSRRWSYGVALNYTAGDATSEYDNERDTYKNHAIGLTLRLSH